MGRAASPSPDLSASLTSEGTKAAGDPPTDCRKTAMKAKAGWARSSGVGGRSSVSSSGILPLCVSGEAGRCWREQVQSGKITEEKGPPWDNRRSNKMKHFLKTARRQKEVCGFPEFLFLF